MAQLLSQADSLPAISVTSPQLSEPSSSPATLEALDDSRLTPALPLPKTSLDQRQTFTKPAMSQPVPSPVFKHSFPSYNTQFRFFGERQNVLGTQREFSRCGVRDVPCHVHSRNVLSGDEGRKDGKKKVNAEDEKYGPRIKRPKETIPSFSSPWAPSSCSPKKVIWKEVEDYNRQRKRVRFVGWAGIENPWETEGSSTACSEGSDCSDDNESSGSTKRSSIPSESQQTRIGEATGNGDRKRELGGYDGMKVVITTSKNGMTTTVLEPGPNTDLGNGIEIVTKTVVRGDEVTTVTTTTLIPLVDMKSRTEIRD
ncbi:hypothetical protein N431DRAFT_428462 [Stipitochalara longipes BDJ]|nr:hypothetical protein N431DRAFT_428462 [Stipitochalara longipes BDJ]